MHPLTGTDIELGEALCWDVYDKQGNLLLRKGYVVASARQLEALLSRGLFADAEEYAQARPEAADATIPPAADEPLSALRLTRQATRKLEAVLTEQATTLPAAFPGEINDVAALVESAIDIDPDVTLAGMLFKQEVRNYAVRHCIDAAIISALIARGMGMTAQEVRTVSCAALTMNIGMLDLQNTLQYREQAPTEDEKRLIRYHPQASVDMLKQAGVDDDAWLSCILHHHENVDGTGYPGGLKGDAIPDNAKLISLADRYTAMLAPRAYRKAILPNEALRRLLLDRGKGVDAVMAAHFIRTMGVYPPGTFVRLRSSETAVVSHRGKNSATPVVHALIGPFGAPLPYPHRRETDSERYEIREALHIEQGTISFNMQQIWGSTAAG